jgi:hypothetical protein
VRHVDAPAMALDTIADGQSVKVFSIPIESGMGLSSLQSGITHRPEQMGR